MIKYQLFQNTKMGNDMAKEELNDCFCCVVECSHGLYQFGKVINCNNDVLVDVLGGWSTLHEVNALLAKGVGRDDWME